MLYYSKLESLVFILVLSASHHFILLHCQEPSPSAEYSPPAPHLELSLGSLVPYLPPPLTPPDPPSPLPSPSSLPSPRSPWSLPASPPPEPPPPSPWSLPASPPLESPPLPQPPKKSPPAQAPTPIIDARNRTTSTGLIAGAVIGSVLIVAGLCTCFFIWRNRRSRPSPQPPKADEEVAPSSASVGLRLGPTTFTYGQLALATNGFSDSNFLGEGGYGVVHKGFNPYDKRTYVAIKQLKCGIQQAHKEFHNEIAIINRVHHKHLVSLVGFCMDEARSKMMLVYEFVSNNTLAFHLHGKGTETIDWKKRMKIAIGSAKGLAYLHEECHPKIIHRDIKASNILLDDNFEPKVADFGLARFSIESQIMTRVMGSFGYLAPEYAASGKLTEKSDVFSFGVVLLELITGRKPVDDAETFPNGSMVEWARTLFSEALDNGQYEGIVDERLENDYDVEEMLRMISCAANCVRHSATNRPRMTQVVQALEGAIWLENDMTGESLARPQLSEDMNKIRKMAMGSYSTTQSDQLHSATSTTSSSGSKIFK